ANNLVVGSGAAAMDYYLEVNGETNDGLVTWMEDEDYFQFNDGILIPAGEQIYFRDTAIYIHSNADGYLDLVADTGVRVSTLTSGRVPFAGASGVLLDDANFTYDSATDQLTLAQTGVGSGLELGSGAVLGSLYMVNGGILGVELTLSAPYIALTPSAGDVIVSGGDLVMNPGGNYSIYVGDTANTGMTRGVTINQGAADDEILALKSSDVDHGMTTLAESDTYAMFKKPSGVGGGLLLYGLSDLDTSTAAGALVLAGVLGIAADTTK